MVNAEEARELAKNYKEKTIEDICGKVLSDIKISATKGKYQLSTHVPASSALIVKKFLKDRGFVVSVYKSFNSNMEKKECTGEIDINWLDVSDHDKKMMSQDDD